MAGLRLATVSTVSFISVGGMIGRGALGRMFIDGYRRNIDIEVWAALFAVVGLALALDLLISLAGRDRHAVDPAPPGDGLSGTRHGHDPRRTATG